MPDLTQEETDLIAEYAAGILLKYDKDQHAGFQNAVVQRGRFKAELFRLQQLGAQPRPQELFGGHAVVGEETQRGEGSRAQDAHPGHGFGADTGFQQKGDKRNPSN